MAENSAKKCHTLILIKDYKDKHFLYYALMHHAKQKQRKSNVIKTALGMKTVSTLTNPG